MATSDELLSKFGSYGQISYTKDRAEKRWKFEKSRAPCAEEFVDATSYRKDECSFLKFPLLSVALNGDASRHFEHKPGFGNFGNVSVQQQQQQQQQNTDPKYWVQLYVQNLLDAKIRHVPYSMIVEILIYTQCLKGFGRNVASMLDIGERTLTTRKEGRNLRDWFTNRAQMKARLNLPLFYSISLDCVVAVQTIHRAGFIHNDIKPDNILVRRKDGDVADHVLKIRLIDFTNSMLINRCQKRKKDDTSPIFQSPETMAFMGIDEKSDVWRLGASLFEYWSHGVRLCSPYYFALKMLHSVLDTCDDHSYKDLANVAEKMMQSGANKSQEEAEKDETAKEKSLKKEEDEGDEQVDALRKRVLKTKTLQTTNRNAKDKEDTKRPSSPTDGSASSTKNKKKRLRRRTAIIASPPYNESALEEWATALRELFVQKTKNGEPSLSSSLSSSSSDQALHSPMDLRLLVFYEICRLHYHYLPMLLYTYIPDLKARHFLACMLEPLPERRSSMSDLETQLRAILSQIQDAKNKNKGVLPSGTMHFEQASHAELYRRQNQCSRLADRTLPMWLQGNVPGSVVNAGDLEQVLKSKLSQLPSLHFALEIFERDEMRSAAEIYQNPVLLPPVDQNLTPESLFKSREYAQAASPANPFQKDETFQPINRSRWQQNAIQIWVVLTFFASLMWYALVMPLVYGFRRARGFYTNTKSALTIPNDSVAFVRSKFKHEMAQVRDAKTLKSFQYASKFLELCSRFRLTKRDDTTIVQVVPFALLCRLYASICENQPSVANSTSNILLSQPLEVAHTSISQYAEYHRNDVFVSGATTSRQKNDGRRHQKARSSRAAASKMWNIPWMAHFSPLKFSRLSSEHQKRVAIPLYLMDEMTSHTVRVKNLYAVAYPSGAIHNFWTAAHEELYDGLFPPLTSQIAHYLCVDLNYAECETRPKMESAHVLGVLSGYYTTIHFPKSKRPAPKRKTVAYPGGGGGVANGSYLSSDFGKFHSSTRTSPYSNSNPQDTVQNYMSLGSPSSSDSSFRSEGGDELEPASISTSSGASPSSSPNARSYSNASYSKKYPMGDFGLSYFFLFVMYQAALVLHISNLLDSRPWKIDSWVVALFGESLQKLATGMAHAPSAFRRQVHRQRRNDEEENGHEDDEKEDEDSAGAAERASDFIQRSILWCLFDVQQWFLASAFESRMKQSAEQGKN